MAELIAGDAVIVPMVGNIETVTKNESGLVSTDGTGSDSAYLWNTDDLVDVITRPNSGGAS
ncbi:hypothetical protein ACWKSP_26340 [Micromonosporaceae bacterium Da 78-11]